MKNHVEQAIALIRTAKQKGHPTDGATPSNVAAQLMAAQIIADAIDRFTEAFTNPVEIIHRDDNNSLEDLIRESIKDTDV